jgi:hypothetical protein
VTNRPHVVQPVRELDDENPAIGREGSEGSRQAGCRLLIAGRGVESHGPVHEVSDLGADG